MKLLMNPVMNKEFKLRFRSFKSFLGLMFYLIALSIIIVGFIFIQSQSYGTNYFRPEESRIMFMVLSFIQLGLILFVTPGLTAGVISGEREKQTLNILLTTTQTSAGIIIGKLISSVSFLLLMIVASMPIYSIVFLFGGISPLQVLTVLGYYILIIFVFGSFGVLFSTLIRRTIISMITTYGTALFFAGGTAFLFVVSMEFGGLMPGSSPVPYFIAILNPFIVLMGFLEPSLVQEINRQTGILFPLWASQLIVYGILFSVALAVSIRRLRPRAATK
ncbi:ABC transporter permease [Neobacillus notoginsengisoli]|uniref:ABC transporter permease n=1 Tax=Neobacillus notoginsengisoli TaxID=1578198 RepID=A0A417YQB4_9BACI|nr:ABC transporter permease subunit [Neobacillus notoginsengisoli]RHW36437.1 ABC transporter permease [Neobacillus notoginsengisoli]